MRSVRLDEDLEAQLAEASRITGQPVSQIIREAVAERCGRLLGERLDRHLADVVGIVSSEGGRADDTGREFVAGLRRRERTSSR